MEWFKQLKIGTKLVLGFLVVSLLGVVIGLQGIYRASQINDLASVMYDREMVGLRHAAEANVQLMAAGRGIRAAMLANSQEERTKQLKQVENTFLQIHEELETAEKTFFTENGKALLKETRSTLSQYEQSILEVKKRLEREPVSAVRESVEYLNTVASPLSAQLDMLMTKMVERKVKNASDLNDDTDSIYNVIFYSLTALTLAGLLIGMLVGTLLTRHLTRQLGGEPADAAALATRIADGDLTARVNTSASQPGSVMYAMNQMQEALINVVSTVRTSSDGIAAGATQIANGNADLSSRTEQQAASLQETAASMEEITATVRQNADNARQASTLANDASRTADEGRTAVHQVVETMQGINESSQRISNIINVIDSIAFQTNILALNASVEAARAGEQGRGFAVVAGEVRNLASRSADAAREIKTLIEDSTRRVAEGSKQVEQAGHTIGNVVSSVRRVTDIIDEISAASQEQSEGISQVNVAVAQMDQVTQQNAGLVQESTVASSALAEEARNLLNVVAIFRLNESAARAQAAPRRAAAHQPAAPKVPAKTFAPAPVARSTASTAPAKSNDDDWETF